MTQQNSLIVNDPEWRGTQEDLGATIPQVARILEYRQNPVEFVTRVLGITPEDYQCKVLQSVADNDRTAVHTGHGVGKTAVASWIVIWFTFIWGPCKVVTTAPSWRQVEDLLWAEIHKWLRNSHLEEELGWVWPFKLLDTRLEIQQEWFATGEASDEPVKMEGYHAPNMLYVFDEAKAVPDPTFEAAEGALTGDNSRVVMISTPGGTSGQFYRVCSGVEPGYKVFHVNGEESPRVSKSWVEARKRAWGEKSSLYKQRVQGLFADAEDDTVVFTDWMLRAVAQRDSVPRTRPHVIAGDIANRGSDETVLSVRHGNYVYDQKILVDARTPGIVRTIMDMIEVHDADEVVIDANGWGAGVYDDLVDLQNSGKIPYRVNIVGFMAGEKSSDTRAFINRRAELWWQIRTLLTPLSNIGLPDDQELSDQMTNIKYNVNDKDLIQIESKEKMRKRGVASPDRADSITLLWAGTLPEIDREEPKYVGHTIAVTGVRRAP